MRGSDFSAGQEDVDAVVMMAEAAGMMEAAEGSDYPRCFSNGLSDWENSYSLPGLVIW